MLYTRKSILFYLYYKGNVNGKIIRIFLNAGSPVITEPKKDIDRANVFKVPVQLKMNFRWNLKYYSWTKDTTVSMYKKTNGTNTDSSTGEVIYSVVDVILPVFSHNVTTKGILATVTLNIDTEEDLGMYDIMVSNDVGNDVLTIELVPVGTYLLYHNVGSAASQSRRFCRAMQHSVYKRQQRGIYFHKFKETMLFLGIVYIY